MKTHIQKLGDGLALVIPPEVASRLGLADGAEVEVAVETGRLVIYPPGIRRYTLEEMLEGITDENIHPGVDSGPPVGRELW